MLRDIIYYFASNKSNIDMKNFLFVLAAFFVILSSCKKDDCEAGALDTVIVGTWDVIVLGSNTGEVEFKANGDLIDADDILVGGESGGESFNIKSYVVNSDSLLTLKAESVSGSSIEYDLDITSFDCDRIEFDFGGIPGYFDRD